MINESVNRRIVIRKVIQLMTIKRELVNCRCCCCRIDEQVKRNNSFVSNISAEIIGGGGRVKRGGGGRRNIIRYDLFLNGIVNIYVRSINISS
jgi:hypothetical protein